MPSLRSQSPALGRRQLPAYNRSQRPVSCFLSPRQSSTRASHAVTSCSFGPIPPVDLSERGGVRPLDLDCQLKPIIAQNLCASMRSASTRSVPSFSGKDSCSRSFPDSHQTMLVLCSIFYNGVAGPELEALQVIDLNLTRGSCRPDTFNPCRTEMAQI